MRQPDNRNCSNDEQKPTPAVVVGVDGSGGAETALRWAFNEARLRDAPVRAVHAWTFGYGSGSLVGYPYADAGLGLDSELGIDLDRLRGAAEELLDRALADLGDEARDVTVERRVIRGGGAEVLLDQAGPDDLLVVGSRGHGGFTGLLLGSVSQQCVHHAACPVVVVHAETPTAKSNGHSIFAQEQTPATA
jgi:nucleotide-binding universal stress UspA family protein